jgi:hypothetical protein
MRVCLNCQRRLSHEDLLITESERMELARASVGLEGLSFRYYTCPRCGQDHVFLEVAQLPRESDQDFRRRQVTLAQAAQEVRVDRTTILVVEQGIWQGRGAS